ncbi:MAG: hypothetical protein ACLS9X_07795 [Faecalibacterium sp.]
MARQMTENLAESGCPQDIEEAAVQASEDVVAQREEALQNSWKNSAAKSPSRGPAAVRNEYSG